MEDLKEQIGFKGIAAGVLCLVSTDPRFMPFKTADEVLQAYRDIYDKVKPRLTQC